MIPTGTCNRRQAMLGAVLLLAEGCAGKPLSGGSSDKTAAPLDVNFVSRLNGAQEEHPTPSTATGNAALYLEPDGTLHWVLTHSLPANQVRAAYIHGPAPLGQSASAIVNIGADGFASPIKGQAFITPGQVDDLERGQCYINIYTAAYPADGEIRGQIGPG